MTIAQQLNITKFPFEIKDEKGRLIYAENKRGYWAKMEYDEDGNQIYREDSDGDWSKWDYDQDGKEIYYENSDGKILDKRPKPEPEPEKKQTAVRWLLNNLLIKGLLRLTKDEHPLYKELKDHAKAMEKEQIINTWSEATAPDHEIGLSDTSYIISQIQKAEKYYNETYGGDK